MPSSKHCKLWFTPLYQAACGVVHEYISKNLCVCVIDVHTCVRGLRRNRVCEQLIKLAPSMGVALRAPDARWLRVTASSASLVTIEATVSVGSGSEVLMTIAWEEQTRDEGGSQVRAVITPHSTGRRKERGRAEEARGSGSGRDAKALQQGGCT